MSKSTKVINIKNAPIGWKDNPEYVYIGRAGKGLDGYYGNPFILQAGERRGDTLDRYRAYVDRLVEMDRTFRKRVKSLYGKTLVCFCKPKACHGDILAEYAERLWLKDTK